MLPKVSKKPDYEAEFAFVIGTGGRHIKAEDWTNHVFGYTIVNDVTGARLPARDHAMADGQDVRHVRADGALDCDGR